MMTVSRSLTALACAALLIPMSALAEEAPIATSTATPTETSATPPLHRPLLRNATTTRPALPIRGLASSTKPLPKDIEERIQNREQARDCINGGSTTDCALQNGDERRAEARARMEEKRSEILKHVAEQVFGRMGAAIERLSKLGDRVDSRIAKLKEQGVDTSKSEELMKTTRTKIAEASTALDAAKQEIDAAALLADASASSTKPVDAGKPVRESLEKARTAVVAAHKALVAAVESLKASAALRENVPGKGGALRVKDAPEGTSTQVNPTL